MKIVFIIISISFCFFGKCASADISSSIEEMLNPGSRFKTTEQNSHGTYDMRTFQGFYFESNSVRTFIISNLVDKYQLVIDANSSGVCTAHFETSTNPQNNTLGHAIIVSQNSGRFDQTDQTLSKRLKTKDGIPTTIVFGVYWNLRDSGMGLDVVDYTVAFKLDEAGPIKVVSCRHSLQGTPLEAPKEAVANMAVGAMLAEYEQLNSLASLLENLKTAPETEKTASEKRSIQTSLDAAIVQINDLAKYTSRANTIVADRAQKTLSEGQALGKKLQVIRDRELVAVYAPDVEKKIESILAAWANSGIPLNTFVDKSK